MTVAVSQVAPVSKVIVVTGGSRGIGRATALACARCGWAIAFSYRERADAASSLQTELERMGTRCTAIRADTSVEADVMQLFEQTENVLGPINGVVVNAGILAPAQLLVDMSAARLRHLFEVNVLGYYLTAREAARRLSRDRGGSGGSMVFVSSVASRIGMPGEYVDYAGSKGAIDSLTIGLSKELGPSGIRVNAVRPGLIDTEIHTLGAKPDRAVRLGTSTPLGRAGSAAEVAQAIIWLLGDEASYVSGAIVDVAGGR